MAHFKQAHPCSSPLIDSQGTIYVGSSDNNLYAIDDNQTGPAASPWPMFRHDARHTGSVKQEEGVNPVPRSTGTGRWMVTETMRENSCEVPVGETDVYTLTIEQNGDSLTFDGSFQGSLNQEKMQLSRFPKAGGVANVTHMDVTVSVDGKRFSGDASWKWVGPGDPCEGTVSFSARLESGDPLVLRNSPPVQVGGGNGGGGGSSDALFLVMLLFSSIYLARRHTT